MRIEVRAQDERWVRAVSQEDRDLLLSLEGCTVEELAERGVVIHATGSATSRGETVIFDNDIDWGVAKGRLVTSRDGWLAGFQVGEGP